MSLSSFLSGMLIKNKRKSEENESSFLDDPLPNHTPTQPGVDRQHTCHFFNECAVTSYLNS